jgi:hypothetical protein
MNSTVPADVYPTAFASAIACMMMQHNDSIHSSQTTAVCETYSTLADLFTIHHLRHAAVFTSQYIACMLPLYHYAKQANCNKCKQNCSHVQIKMYVYIIHIYVCVQRVLPDLA